MKLSVVMSVYYKETPEFLSRCFKSLVAQSLPADEVIIVKDGPISAGLEQVIAGYSKKLPMGLVALPRNLGLGAALRIGVEKCRGDLIARMDSDDICISRRFELQSKVFADNPGVDVLGGAIAEFDSDPQKPIAVRRMPAFNAEIVRYAKFRNPLNHMTVMCRRGAVLRAGNYQPFSGFEDYHLWARMLMARNCFHNLDDILVLVRVGNGMLERRSGLKYLGAEIEFQRFLLSSGLISAGESAYNILLRAPVRLAPLPLRSLIYRKLLRSS